MKKNLKYKIGELWDKVIGNEKDELDLVEERVPTTFMENSSEEKVVIETRLDINQNSVEKPMIMEKEEEKEVEPENKECYTFFIDPKSYEDCKKIANHIKKDDMVTMNLENLEDKMAQRVLDFIVGASTLKGSTFHKVSGKVYTSIPKRYSIQKEV
jgi:cell division inhibitor SepF